MPPRAGGIGSTPPTSLHHSQDAGTQQSSQKDARGSREHSKLEILEKSRKAGRVGGRGGGGGMQMTSKGQHPEIPVGT